MSAKVDHTAHTHTDVPQDRMMCEHIREQAARTVTSSLLDPDDSGLPVHVHLIAPTIYLASIDDDEDGFLDTVTVTVEGNGWERMSILVQWIDRVGRLVEHRTEASVTHG